MISWQLRFVALCSTTQPGDVTCSSMIYAVVVPPTLMLDGGPVLSCADVRQTAIAVRTPREIVCLVVRIVFLEEKRYYRHFFLFSPPFRGTPD